MAYIENPVTYVRKMFMKLTPGWQTGCRTPGGSPTAQSSRTSQTWSQCYKTFYSRKVQIFVIS